MSKIIFGTLLDYKYSLINLKIYNACDQSRLADASVSIKYKSFSRSIFGPTKEILLAYLKIRVLMFADNVVCVVCCKLMISSNTTTSMISSNTTTSMRIVDVSWLCLCFSSRCSQLNNGLMFRQTIGCKSANLIERRRSLDQPSRVIRLNQSRQQMMPRTVRSNSYVIMESVTAEFDSSPVQTPDDQECASTNNDITGKQSSTLT
jgi:hypothetical protein